MKNLYEDFLKFIETENKEKAVEFMLSKLSKLETAEGLVRLYTEVLERSLNEMNCGCPDKKVCIWKEHVRTSIIRTIIECAYPFVVELRNKQQIVNDKGKVIVVCPDGEYHEIGARMVADFFTLSGYDALYIGSSTPKEEFIDVINIIKPKILAISVTNYYNLVSAKKTIETIRKKVNYPILIGVGGYAFLNKPDVYKEIGADILIQSYEDIQALEVRV